MWLNALEQTFLLIVLTSLISVSIGTVTAVAAWWSNKTWAYYIPLLMLGIPPWLLSYYISEFGYINPWIGASLSMGLCCSVYPHSLISASLANRAHKAWEMMIVVNGKNLKSLFTAIWPSLKFSFLPSVAIIAAECVSDFGVSNFYGLNTVTMLTYNIWTSTWNISQIVYGIISLAVLGYIISQMDVMTVSYLQNDNTNKQSLTWGLLSILPTILLIGFGVYQSVTWILFGGEFYKDDFIKEFSNTMWLTSAVVISCLAITSAYLSGVAKMFLEKLGLGLYSIPGAVIGALVLYSLGQYVPLMALLILAVFLRFYGLMINTVATADKGNQRYFEVIDMYSTSRTQKIINKARIVLPSVSIGLCLIVLDVIRELPISMILQPMNFQTLAMRMNYIARNENIPMLGPHSLVILSLGIVLCSVIIKLIYDSDKKSKL